MKNADDTRVFPYHEEGMFLRDWFAGQAIIGLMTKNSHLDTTKELKPSDLAAELAYKYADALMKERLK